MAYRYLPVGVFLVIRRKGLGVRLGCLLVDITTVDRAKPQDLASRVSVGWSKYSGLKADFTGVIAEPTLEIAFVFTLCV